MIPYRNPRNTYSAFERKAASFLLAAHLVSLGVSPLMSGEAKSGFLRHMGQLGYGASWYAVLALVGIVLLAGSQLPCRSLRHMGLFGSLLLQGAMAIQFMIAGLWIPITLIFAVNAAASFWLIVADVRRKPRWSPRG